MGSANWFFLVAFAAASALPQDHERILFVDPPLRVITQCEFESKGPGEIQCRRDGWLRRIPLSRSVTAWRGADTPGVGALRRGDILDIRMGLDADTGKEVAEFIWANLVKVEGVVRRSGRGWMLVSPLIPATIGELAPELVYVRFDGSTQLLGAPAGASAGPRAGKPVVVIGLRTGPNRVHASRLLLYSDALPPP